MWKQMETNGTEKNEKNEQIFYCEKCNYKCLYRSDWNRHITTRKHILSHDWKQMETNGNEKNEKIKEIYYVCEKCEKQYESRTGLWKHKNKCLNNNDLTDKNIIMTLIKENSDYKKIIVEQQNMMAEQQNMMLKVIENGTHNTTNTNTNTKTNNNSHNKTFNLQFFLNETCKNAMNITDFVESIQLQLSDLEKVGKLGYVEGISDIIIKNLKSLDITERPVHCTDKKRETLYVKDGDKWEKDNEKIKMHKTVKKIAHKNAKLLPAFRELHPDCNKSSSKYSDQYNKIIVESMGGNGDNDYDKEEKIIKNISKEVMVDKTCN